jgi:hypothetical protein
MKTLLRMMQRVELKASALGRALIDDEREFVVYLDRKSGIDSLPLVFDTDLSLTMVY